MKKVLQRVIKKFQNFKNRKTRFLFACAYNFYIKQARIELDGIGFLPFINAQHRHDWAKIKANEFVKYCKKHNIVNQRYSLALQYAKLGR